MPTAQQEPGREGDDEEQRQDKEPAGDPGQWSAEEQTEDADQQQAGMATTTAAMILVTITTGMVMITAMMETITQAMPSPIITSHIRPTFFQFSRTIANPRRRDSRYASILQNRDPPEEVAQQVEKNAQDDHYEDHKEHQTDDSCDAYQVEGCVAVSELLTSMIKPAIKNIRT